MAPTQRAGCRSEDDFQILSCHAALGLRSRAAQMVLGPSQSCHRDVDVGVCHFGFVYNGKVMKHSQCIMCNYCVCNHFLSRMVVSCCFTGLHTVPTRILHYSTLMWRHRLLQICSSQNFLLMFNELISSSHFLRASHPINE